MSDVHPTTSIDSRATIAPSARVDRDCIVEGEVRIGEDVRIHPRVILRGPLTIGAGSTIYPGVCIGYPAQDIKFDPDRDTSPGVTIGERTVLREFVTIHAATKEHPTSIGDGCYLMVGAHVGHDCVVGNNVTMVNSCQLAGHCEIGAGVIMSGLSGLHQFTRVGRLAMISGGTAAGQDIPPFCVLGERNRITTINRIGMRRSGMSREDIRTVHDAYREIFATCLPRREMIERLREITDCAPIDEMREFVEQSQRGICPGPAKPPRLIASWLRYRRRGVAIEGDDL